MCGVVIICSHIEDRFEQKSYRAKKKLCNVEQHFLRLHNLRLNTGTFKG